jgi:hypothetical protein
MNVCKEMKETKGGEVGKAENWLSNVRAEAFLSTGEVAV